MPLFHYSSYWRTWSRVILFEEGEMVEVNLTPIPNCHDSTWERDVRPVRVRRHVTEFGEKDLLTGVLPREVEKELRRYCTPEQVSQLLHGRILRVIDWEKYRRVNNGGANLSDILKD